MVRVMVKQVIISLLTVTVGLLRVIARTIIRFNVTLNDMHLMLLQNILHSSTFIQLIVECLFVDLLNVSPPLLSCTCFRTGGVSSGSCSLLRNAQMKEFTESTPDSCNSSLAYRQAAADDTGLA